MSVVIGFIVCVLGVVFHSLVTALTCFCMDFSSDLFGFVACCVIVDELVRNTVPADM
jgi:hypothetical protein